ncbi:MAG: 4a-hydroxytetrahydrobiopterin dehydratase [Prochlorococcus marinus CUG1438]|nr:4a-hydroxytetrahydrobiopterin dehydratase [Prochlorococcus marinus CUG1438]
MWTERESPLRIEKRFEFEKYSKISKFMERIEKLCKERDIYPNISFGKNFVSLSIFLESKAISIKEKDFSKDIDKFYLED